MSKSRRQQINESIQQIREFYALGCRSLKARPLKAKYREREIDTEAERIGINPDTLRKARQFADPEQGYTRSELADLCRELRRIPGDEREAAIARSHVIRLLTVKNKRQRRALQRRAIAAGWSLGQLDAAIAAHFGTRRAGGRRAYVPTDLDHALGRMERMCERWRRWYRELQAGDEPRSEHVTLSDMSPKIQSLLKTDVMPGLARLQAAVARELRRLQPSRHDRVIYEEGRAATGK